MGKPPVRIRTLGSQAVSYTHLDVYKRQVEDGLVTGIEIEAAWVAPSVLGVRATFTGGAVEAPYVFQIQVSG